MFTRTKHIVNETIRFFLFTFGTFRNFLYSCYVARLTSAGWVAHFLLHCPSVKKHLDSLNGDKEREKSTLFSKLTVNWLLPFFVGTTNKRVLVRFLDLRPVFSCVLKCDYCFVMSPLLKGYVPAEELIEWIETWSKKVVPLEFMVTGGEPLLHPELVRILDAARKAWKHSRLELITNGMLLTKCQPAVFEAIRANRFDVLVTKHFDNPEYNEKFWAGIDVLKKEKIAFSIRRSDKYWFKAYQKDENGKPIPFHSNDPCKSHKNCFNKINVLADNSLWYCCLLPNTRFQDRAGILGDGWQEILDHRPLTSENSRTEIIRYLYGGVRKECHLCPEHYEYIVPCELGAADSPQAKRKL
ncbi:MAG: radical SAM protein [Planctomycetaceae bacterium]|nr:radical SAM protein [Planctomycetaceae bacterium]